MPYRLDALWYSPILSPLFFVSSIMAGLAVTLLVYPLAARIVGKEVDNDITKGLARIAAWVTLVYTLLKLGDLSVAGELPALFAFDRASLLMWLELGLGAILPMILFFVPSLAAQRRWQTVGALLILFGVLLNRFNATLFAQQARPGASYLPNLVEWLSTLGVLAAAALAWYVGVRYLSLFDSKSHDKFHR